MLMFPYYLNFEFDTSQNTKVNISTAKEITNDKFIYKNI